MKGLNAALVATSVMIVTAGAAAAQDAPDAAKGKRIFNQCMACHALDHAVVGPPLGGVVGRPAGSVAGFSYSAVMKTAGENGLVWTKDNIVDYLKNPTAYLKAYDTSKGKTPEGSSKMVFMLSNENQRKDVVAYLETTKK